MHNRIQHALQETTMETDRRQLARRNDSQELTFPPNQAPVNIDALIDRQSIEMEAMIANFGAIADKAGLEAEIDNSIDLIEQPDGTRTVRIKKVTTFVKDPS